MVPKVTQHSVKARESGFKDVENVDLSLLSESDSVLKRLLNNARVFYMERKRSQIIEAKRRLSTAPKLITFKS